MKCASLPSSYRYWTLLTSVWTRENFSPARNVRSTTAPDSSAFSFVRTNAPPFPGFTCWNSTIRHTEPSTSMCIPFLNWFVLTVSATAAESLVNRYELLGVAGQDLGAVVAEHDEILHPPPADAGLVDPGPDGEAVPRLQRVAGLLGKTRGLVDEQAHTVAQPVSELVSEPGLLDRIACDAVGIGALHPGTDRVDRGLLRLQADGVGLGDPPGQLAGGERPRAVRAVAVDHRPGVHDDRVAVLDDPIAWMRVRQRASGACSEADVERETLRAELVQQYLQPPGEVALGPADERLLGQPCEGAGGDLRRAPDRGE